MSSAVTLVNAHLSLMKQHLHSSKASDSLDEFIKEQTLENITKSAEHATAIQSPATSPAQYRELQQAFINNALRS